MVVINLWHDGEKIYCAFLLRTAHQLLIYKQLWTIHFTSLPKIDYLGPSNQRDLDPVVDSPKQPQISPDRQYHMIMVLTYIPD